MMRAGSFAILAAAATAATLPLSTQAAQLGDDADACASIGTSAILANIVGLKDRTGRIKLELWNADEDDFLKDDRILKREGHFFRRVWADTPPSGPVSMCIRTPGPGRYALLFTHDRDHKNKFNFWKDGAGFPNVTRLGRNRPSLEQAEVTVGSTVTTVTIHVQYLRGLFAGFGPVDDED